MFLDRFVAQRSAVLNPPAQSPDIEALARRYPAHDPFLSSMYGAFDGERDQGALLPAHRVRRVREVIAAGDNNAELVIADEVLPRCFLDFVPVIASPTKTDIGVFTERSTFVPSAVVEFDYELGEARVLSTSLSGYFEAYMALSIMWADNALSRSRPRGLTVADLNVLTQFSCIRYPLVDEAGVTRFNVHDL